MHDSWWHDATVYQLYLRSFADGDGDGIGDIAGLRSRLGYLRALGVDAIWLNPCYLSPQRDHRYDIADYFRPDPSYGTLEELTAFVDEAHASGLRVLMDMVANHCSSEHSWFQEALRAEPGSPERARFIFRDGRGTHGYLPPNNWQSVFGGPAWTRVTDDRGVPEQWYFHAFDSAQPDFDWRNPEVAEMFDSVLRHWFDLGIDGFRIDVAHGLFKSAELADWPGADDGTGGHNAAMWDQPEVHDIYRRWRAIGDDYDPPRYFVGEIWVADNESLRRYVAPGELHQAFTFDLLVQPWNAERMQAAIIQALRQADDAPAWTLSNHDVHRTVTRYGQDQLLERPDPSDMIAAARRRGEVDMATGVRRARAAAALQLSLPGAVFLYQGEELGLPEVFDLPDAARQDPIWVRSAGAELGRDGCRIPLPWTSNAPTFGFSTEPVSAAPWLPQPADFGSWAVDLQDRSADSVLALYRRLTAARRTVFGGDSLVTWLPTGRDDVLALQRGSGVCIVNFGTEPFPIPELWSGDLVVSTQPSADASRVVDGDSAVWLVLDRVLAVEAGSVHELPTDSPTPQLESTVV
ncbi:MAG TPA: alpha-amylase family glycosyl hydrolase [Pseudolysinimonas sp.]|nr:alpha-amylase family glycosyl hydrolase [Pseudolysinimonas sp.]